MPISWGVGVALKGRLQATTARINTQAIESHLKLGAFISITPQLKGLYKYRRQFLVL
jgi:hypothetical protein